MRPLENAENPVLDTAKGLASLSIVIDDFDSAKSTSNKEMKISQDAATLSSPPRLYARSPSDNSIKKILEEAEHRKHEFWKLLEEYSEVVENIKRIEELEHNNLTNKVQSPIST